MSIFDKVIKNGTTVLIKESQLKATVIGVCVRGIDNVTIEYQCQWVDTSGVHDYWLYSYMVQEFIDTRKPAGMVNYETNIQLT